MIRCETCNRTFGRAVDLTTHIRNQGGFCLLGEPRRGPGRPPGPTRPEVKDEAKLQDALVAWAARIRAANRVAAGFSWEDTP